ncbi:N-acetyl sugar amidotransferase, partial [Vibrio anguillarum]|nr:N-acetyl sugar amidotransferase [Vibrio anguillarum]
SRILSGDITREEALDELNKPLYDEAELTEDKHFVAKKLGITVENLDEMTSSPGRSYKEFKNWDSRYNMMKGLQRFLNKMLKTKVRMH